MNASHFVAEHRSARDGFTWTLPSRLGALLNEAERLYGERDRSYTILGVEFGPGDPQIWFPGNRRHIVIQLADNALENTALAVYQLAHETIHLLSPTGTANAPVLEEGLATAFAEGVVARDFSRTGMT